MIQTSNDYFLEMDSYSLKKLGSVHLVNLMPSMKIQRLGGQFPIAIMIF